VTDTDDVVRRFDDGVNALERIAVALETLTADLLVALEGIYGAKVYGKTPGAADSDDPPPDGPWVGQVDR